MDNYAVVKIGYSASTGMVKVSVDEKNTGAFHTCFTEKVDLKPNWWRTAYLGISASTGQLADNHDILSVETIVGESDPDKVTMSNIQKATEEVKAVKKDMNNRLKQFNLDMDTLSMSETNLVKVMTKLYTQQSEEIEKLSRELEHTLVGRFFVHSFTHSIIHSFIHSFTHSIIHSFIQSLNKQ